MHLERRELCNEGIRNYVHFEAEDKLHLARQTSISPHQVEMLNLKKHQSVHVAVGLMDMAS